MSNKHHSRAYNHRIKAKAIRALGGACCKCGFSDHRALQFDHIQPLLTASKRQGGLGVSARAVLRGDTNIQLLCANCHAIKTQNEWHSGQYNGAFGWQLPEAAKQLSLYDHEGMKTIIE